MHLWTEYEGRTIAEHYTLGKLLRSEGRNGFFATADKDGHPAVIRLTEAHYDEAEQLRRWRQVAEVHQDNLIEIEQVGQTTFEGVALTYALMEPDDANLGDVLKERPLTSAETLQVAKSVLLAIKALHTSGLVHEHVEPVNVLAVGETVKLRSDCVRECVPDGEFNTSESCAELRRRDLHDFGTLLLRCLTLETEFTAAHNNLPDPFKRIIPKALDGSWNLDQLGNVLDPALFAPKLVSAPPSAAPLSTPVAPTRAGAATATTAVPPAPPAPSSGQSTTVRPLVPPGVRQGTASTDTVSEPARPVAPRSMTSQHEPSMPVRSRYDAEPVDSPQAPSKVIWAVCAVAVLLLVLLLWHFFAGRNAETPSQTGHAAPVVSSGAVRQSAPLASAETAIPVPPAAAPVQGPPASVQAEPAQAAGSAGWYVIAFTYNHAAQAATKAQRLRRTHNSLHPQVFTPTGHAPFFVSLGGAMSSQGQAEAVYRHARRTGLPRDTFVRHY